MRKPTNYSNCKGGLSKASPLLDYNNKYNKKHKNKIESESVIIIRAKKNF